MDHHHHQWRPMSHPQSNICPTCSVPHFPFCPPFAPPFPPYSQNPRFPSHLPDIYGAGTPSAYTAHPNDAWNRNHSFEYREGALDYNNGYIGEVERRYKRPRVDEIGSATFGHENNRNPAKILSDDNERRLKLIRDHGGDNSNNSRDERYSNRDFNANYNMYSPFQPNGPKQQYQYSHMNNWQEDYHQHHGMPNYTRDDYQSLPGPVHNLNENRVSGGKPPPPPPPPLPASPPPPVPVELPVHIPSPPKAPSLFPVPVSSSAANPYLHNKPLSHASTAFSSKEWQTSSLPKPLSPDKPTIIDASQLFKQPYRTTRPDHIVIILRGLPGSGKSYLAKMMRDLEVENGGNAPRIHSMDDYFMTEVEKVEENGALKSSSFGRGKKQTVKKVMEYCYEPEMEGAYRDSMLKSFKKTLEEGTFRLVIVDDRNLRVADFAQFWAIAKRSGYEVYISEATYKDPAGCAARNVHGFTLDEIKRMAGQWERAPTLYLQLDIKSLFHGDDLKESGIQEVDMDTEDDDAIDDNPPGLQERKAEKTIALPLEDKAPQASAKDGKRCDAGEDHTIGVKELGKSKWSNDLHEDDTGGSEGMRGNINALSGLIQAYGKQGKSVRWSDQMGYSGFSIGAANKANMRSLVIGPGSGYNLKSNPLPKEESPILSTQSISGSRRQSAFQERLRAEHESFKAVFDKRKRRIGGLDLEED